MCTKGICGQLSIDTLELNLQMTLDQHLDQRSINASVDTHFRQHLTNVLVDSRWNVTYFHKLAIECSSLHISQSALC